MREAILITFPRSRLLLERSSKLDIGPYNQNAAVGHHRGPLGWRVHQFVDVLSSGDFEDYDPVELIQAYECERRRESLPSANFGQEAIVKAK
ncbi:hypothetical protein [Agrobacterium pusense]|uniref:hypothetical protein n=1 Tax=Agrobacterium pusense TaxID=648995 RepID=UPI003850BA0C